MTVKLALSCHITDPIRAADLPPRTAINKWLTPCWCLTPLLHPHRSVQMWGLRRVYRKRWWRGGGGAWNEEDVQMQRKWKWGTCHRWRHPPLHQQVSIRSSTGPSAADRCSRKTEGCRGVKEAINIFPRASLPVSLRLYTSLFSFGPPSFSICPSSLVLRFYIHPPLLSFCHLCFDTA